MLEGISYAKEYEGLQCHDQTLWKKERRGCLLWLGRKPEEEKEEKEVSYSFNRLSPFSVNHPVRSDTPYSI